MFVLESCLNYCPFPPLSPAPAYDASNDFTHFLDQRGRQLQAGWLPWTDRKMDLMMDSQYKSFRDGLVTIFTAGVVFSGGWRLLTAAMANASARVLPVNWRMGWYCIFSVVFIVILHGSGALHLLWILSINYVLSRACTMQGRYGSAAVASSWLFACTMVLASEYYNGFQAVFTSSRAYFNTRILVANQSRVAARTVDVMLRNFFNFCVVHQSKQRNDAVEAEVSSGHAENDLVQHGQILVSFLVKLQCAILFFGGGKKKMSTH